jgi:hypothetical protein
MFPANALLSGRTRVGGIFMFVPILFPSLGAGMIFANLAAWPIRAAREAFEREAKGHKNVSFRKAMKPLSIFTLGALVIFMPLALLGTLNYFYVTAEGVYYNPLPSLSEKHYRWQDIKEIHTRCLAERKNLHLNYKLIMADQRKIDLMEETRIKFVRAFPAIKPYLEKQDGIQYRREITDWGIKRLQKRYKAKDAGEILKILKGRS